MHHRLTSSECKTYSCVQDVWSSFVKSSNNFLQFNFILLYQEIVFLPVATKKLTNTYKNILINVSVGILKVQFIYMSVGPN